MAENKTALTNIIKQCVEALGYDAVLEIVNSTKPTGEEKPKTEEKKAKVEKKPKTENKPRLSRMIDSVLTELKSKFKDAEVQYVDDYKGQFKDYVNGLDDKDYTSKSLTEHMLDFANTKKPAPVAETKTEEKVVKVEEKPKKEKKTTKKKEEPVVNKETLPTTAASNAVEDVVQLTVEELQKIEMIATPGGVFEGKYWDADNGRYVSGPPAVKDEDLVEIGLGKKSYMVGEKSLRVYVEPEDGSADVFVGYVGVGQFKEMKNPNA